MNKAELVAALARNTRTSKAAAERTLNAVLSSVQRGLKRDRVVSLVGFGTFRVNARRPRVGTDPRTGERIRIAASRTVTFKCGKVLKSSV